MPRARGRVRRVAPRVGAGARQRRVRHAAVGVHQRPRPHRTRTRAVHAPPRPRRRARRRRHHRVVDRARATSSSCRTPRTPARSLDALADAAATYGGGECAIADVTDTRVVLAVQGPEARRLLAGVTRGRGRGRALPRRRGALPRSRRRRRRRAGPPGRATPARTASSSTCPSPPPSTVWHALLDAGITPAGLGARDTLRLEAGLPLHGHELGEGITPLQAGLGWVVRFDKGEFRGRAPLLAEQERGVARRLRGLVVEGRQIPREGHAVLRRRHAGRRRHQRQLLAGARARHRARPSSTPRSASATPSRSTSVAARCPPSSPLCRSCPGERPECM